MTENIYESFRAFAESQGVTLPIVLKADGKINRFTIPGDKESSQNGVYILHSDPIRGFIQDWKRSIKASWTPSGKQAKLSAEDRKKLREAEQQYKLEQQAKWEKAALIAYQIWDAAIPVVQKNDHPYLLKKNINPPLDACKIHEGNLIVRVFDDKFELASLQFIKADGSKQFLPNGKIARGMDLLGSWHYPKIILIAEGFATACSLHENTKLDVLIAFSAGNLAAVAQYARKSVPEAHILIMADNDKSGAGQAKADAAALACGGKAIVCPIPGQDFNDYLGGVQ